MATNSSGTTSAPLMRPMTPSSVGPTLRQMEHHFLEAGVHLEGLQGEMEARFELAKARVDAVLSEHREEREAVGVAVGGVERDGEEAGKRPMERTTSSSRHGDSSSRPQTRNGRYDTFSLV